MSCPCSLFGERVPDVPATNDSSAVELGVKFVPAADGYISGIRFYKGTGNTGTHTGTLWTSTGTRARQRHLRRRVRHRLADPGVRILACP